jgi:Mor family transcriptional regulator
MRLSKQEAEERNAEIVEKWEHGVSVYSIAIDYDLSESAVRKILKKMYEEKK